MGPLFPTANSFLETVLVASLAIMSISGKYVVSLMSAGTDNYLLGRVLNLDVFFVMFSLHVWQMKCSTGFIGEDRLRRFKVQTLQRV